MLSKILMSISFFVFLFWACSKHEIQFERYTKTNSTLEFDSTIEGKQAYVPDTTDYNYMPKRILSIEGDFNGDGTKEILREKYFDYTTRKDIQYVPDEGGIDFLMVVDAESQLVSNNDSISPLYLTSGWTWGILSLLNLGDNNDNGIDEVAVVNDAEDMSSLSSCRIYEYCYGIWKMVFLIHIHEQAFWYPDDFDTTIFYREIPGFLEKKNDRWYYYDNDDFWGEGIYLDSTGYPILHPLRIRKKCKC